MNKPPEDVQRVINSYPASVRKQILALRSLLLTTAAKTSGVGQIEETLKWGEPAFLTPATRSGSTVRISWKSKRPDVVGVYFNCNTDLVESFRALFPQDFTFEGNRAILLQAATGRGGNSTTSVDARSMDALQLCFEAALTYHLRKRQAKTARKSANR